MIGLILLGVAVVAVAKIAGSYNSESAEEKPTDVKPAAPAFRGKKPSKFISALKIAAQPGAFYNPSGSTETIALGPNQTITPLLDPGNLDMQATALRAQGDYVGADKLSRLADEVRLAIVRKYQTEPAFKAKVQAQAKRKVLQGKA